MPLGRASGGCPQLPMAGTFAASVGQHWGESPLEVGSPMDPSPCAVPCLGRCAGRGDPPSTTAGVKNQQSLEGRWWRRGGSCFRRRRRMCVVGTWVNVRVGARGGDRVSGGAWHPSMAGGRGGSIKPRPVPVQHCISVQVVGGRPLVPIRPPGAVRAGLGGMVSERGQVHRMSKDCPQ